MLRKIGIASLGLVLVLTIFNGIPIKQAQALAACSALPDPVPITITIGGQTYDNSSGTSFPPIQVTPGQVLTFSWTADLDIRNSTSYGGYYSGGTLGGRNVRSGSGSTSPMPSSGTVSLVGVNAVQDCTPDVQPPTGSLAILGTVSGGSGQQQVVADLRANGQDALTVPSGTSVNVTWNLQNLTSTGCVNNGPSPLPSNLPGPNNSGSFTFTATTTITFGLGDCPYPPPDFGTIFESVTITVTGGAPPDFSLSCAPISSSVNQGYGAAFNATASGTVDPISMSVAISPSGGSAPTLSGVSQTPISPGGTTSTSATTDGSTTPGSYTVTFTGIGGGLTRTCSSTLTVNSGGSPGPFVDINSSPTSVASGGSSTLSWASTNAGSCTASATPANGQWTGAVATSGSQVITNITTNTTFTIVCSGSGFPSPVSDSAGVTIVAYPSPPASFNVSLTKSPAAGGTVTSTSVPSQTDFNCNTSCSSQTRSFTSGTNLWLTAAPASGYKFSTWGGACFGTSPTCYKSNITTDLTVTATFVVDDGSGPLLTITSITPNPADATATVAGTIRAAAKPSGTQCSGPALTKYFPQDATALDWSVSGGPTGTYTISQTNAGVTGAIGGCAPVYVARQYSFSFPVDTSALIAGSYSITVNATGYTGGFSGTASFPVSHNHTLTVAKAGTGTGTVTGTATSGPAISCGVTCSNAYADGTQVTLGAAAAAGSTFAGWSGGGCSGTGSCVVTIGSNVTVTATFNIVACPAGAVQLSSTTINITQTATASAPVGFSGGTFVSGAPAIASVSGSTVTGQGGGQTTITGTGWAHTSGAINCSLSASPTLTVQSFTISSGASPSTINAGAASTITITIGSVQGGTMPVTATLTNGGSLPSGWSVSPANRIINAGSAATFTVSTTTLATQTTFTLNFSGTYNGYAQSTSVGLTVTAPPPNRPTTVSANNAVQCGKIQVTWTAPSGGSTPTGYRVYRDPTPATPPDPLIPGNWQQIGGDLGAAVFSYTDNNPVSPSSANYYAVAAFNASGESGKQQPSPVFITPLTCSTDFTGTSKKIIAVNGVNVSPVPGFCSSDDETAGLPKSFKATDVVRFRVDVCNTTGNQATTNLSITDTLKNLSNPVIQTTGGSGYCGITSQSFSPAVNPTSFTLGLTDLPFGPTGSCWFTYDVTISPPSQGATSFEFQNTVDIYNNSIFKYSFSTQRYTSVRNPLNPEKQETF